MSWTLEELKRIAGEQLDRALVCRLDCENYEPQYRMEPHWSAAAAHWVGRLVELDNAIAARVRPGECVHGVSLCMRCRECKAAVRAHTRGLG